MGGRAIRALVAVVLATSGMVALLASSASAVTTACDTGTAPIVPGSQSNFKAVCAVDDTNSSTRQVLHDFPYGRYHFGAARTVSVTYVATSGVFTAQAGSTFITDTADTVGSGDENHTVTASGVDQTCLNLKNGAFLKTVTSGTAATISNKTASVSTAISGTKTSQVINGSAVILATGTATFSACDAGRTITAGAGIQASTTVLTFVTSKIAVMSKTANANNTSAHTFGAVKRNIKVNDTAGRNFNDAGVTKDSDVITTTNVVSGTVDSAFFDNTGAETDLGLVVSGTCIPDGTTIIAVSSITTAQMSADATCTSAASADITVAITGGTTVSGAPADTFQDGDQFRGIVAGSVDPCSGFIAGGYPNGTYVADVTSGTAIVLSDAATNDASCTIQKSAFGALKRVGLSPPTTATARIIAGATCVTGNLVSPDGNFTDSDHGLVVSGTGAATAPRIVNDVSATTADLNTNCTFAGTKTVTIGVVNVTAPVNGDAAFQLATTIQLQNTLVDGSPPCNSGIPTGTGIVGTWYNPGSYKTGSGNGLAAADYPTESIAQLAFVTSVITFAGYVSPRPASDTDEVGHVDPQTAAHYDIVLPNLPTLIAICPGTDVGSGYTIWGTAAGVQAVTSGAGQPGSAIVRGLDPAGTTGTAYVTIGTTDYTGDTCVLDSTPDLTSNAGFACMIP